ncbi:hypothetical protein ACFL09_03140 [Planctomycetota bacterium]
MPEETPDAPPPIPDEDAEDAAGGAEADATPAPADNGAVPEPARNEAALLEALRPLFAEQAAQEQAAEQEIGAEEDAQPGEPTEEELEFGRLVWPVFAEEAEVLGLRSTSVNWEVFTKYLLCELDDAMWILDPRRDIDVMDSGRVQRWFNRYAVNWGHERRRAFIGRHLRRFLERFGPFLGRWEGE